MSSGASGIKPAKNDFEKHLQILMADLSSLLINDAEGATKVITIDVVNAKSETDAVNVGRSIARNNLLKCAMFGEDPNWGRILAAVGTAEAFLDSNTIDVYLNGSQICGNGAALLSPEKVNLKDRNIHIKVDLKNDLRRNETVTEQVERGVKAAQRETETEMRDMRKAVREDLEKARNEASVIRREMADARREIEREVIQLKKEVDSKIQKAIDNPLANK
jgi:hypothetical protein